MYDSNTDLLQKICDYLIYARDLHKIIITADLHKYNFWSTIWVIYTYMNIKYTKKNNMKKSN
jgi:hypothetical protein